MRYTHSCVYVCLCAVIYLFYLFVLNCPQYEEKNIRPWIKKPLYHSVLSCSYLLPSLSSSFDFVNL